MPSFFSWKIETVLFFLREKEKNGFNLPGKESGLTAYRCLEFGSKDFSHQPSASKDPLYEEGVVMRSMTGEFSSPP